MPEESKSLLIESQASRETLLKELIRNSLVASGKYFSYQMMCLPKPNAIQAQVSPYRDKLRYWSKPVFFFFFFFLFIEVFLKMYLQSAILSAVFQRPLDNCMFYSLVNSSIEALDEIKVFI